MKSEWYAVIAGDVGENVDDAPEVCLSEADACALAKVRARKGGHWRVVRIEEVAVYGSSGFTARSTDA